MFPVDFSHAAQGRADVRGSNGVGPEPSVQMTIVASVGTIGSTFGTGEIGVELNGVQRQVFCQDDETNLQGLESRSYRACNFVHGGLYPY